MTTFVHNTEVTLKADPTFRGVFVGLLADSEDGLIHITAPGGTNKRGIVAFALKDLEPATGKVPKSAAEK